MLVTVLPITPSVGIPRVVKVHRSTSYTPRSTSCTPGFALFPCSYCLYIRWSQRALLIHLSPGVKHPHIWNSFFQICPPRNHTQHYPGRHHCPQWLNGRTKVLLIKASDEVLLTLHGRPLTAMKLWCLSLYCVLEGNPPVRQDRLCSTLKGWLKLQWECEFSKWPFIVKSESIPECRLMKRKPMSINGQCCQPDWNPFLLGKIHAMLKGSWKLSLQVFIGGTLTTNHEPTAAPVVHIKGR